MIHYMASFKNTAAAAVVLCSFKGYQSLFQVVSNPFKKKRRKVSGRPSLGVFFFFNIIKLSSSSKNLLIMLVFCCVQVALFSITAAQSGLLWEVYGNSALSGSPLTSTVVDGFAAKQDASTPFSAELSGTLTMPNEGTLRLSALV